MDILTDRNIVDLQNQNTEFADAEYESVVRGDYHSADGYDSAEGEDTDEFYNADADKKTKYFSKTEMQKRKKERNVRQKERKDDRIATRIERRKNRKAKYGARPLNPFTKGGKQFWKDNLPKLKKKANGNYEKTNQDGKTEEIAKEKVTIIPPPANAPKNTPPAVVETKDLQTKAEIVTTVVNGETVVAKNYSENQTEKATDDKGNEQVYKKEDVVDESSAEAKKPMSPILKYSLIVGSVLVAGVIGYLIYKKMNKK
jgi:hypothetical protein